MGDFGVSENNESLSTKPVKDGDVSDLETVVADRLDNESGKEGIEDLAHLNLKNEDLNKKMNENKHEYLNRDDIVDFQTMNIMAKILGEDSVNRADFKYEEDKSAQRGKDILAAMDTPILLVRAKGTYENSEGDKRYGVDDEALDSLLNSDVSDKAKEYTLMYILAGGKDAFSKVPVDELEDAKWKSLMISIKEDALSILSMYNKDFVNTNAVDQNQKPVDTISDNPHYGDAEDGEDNVEAIKSENKLEKMLEVNLDDFEGLDSSALELSGDDFADGLKKDTIELFSRFKDGSKPRILEKVLKELDDKAIRRILEKYRVILTKYKDNVLDKKMNVSDEIELHENFNFVYSSVRKLDDEYYISKE